MDSVIQINSFTKSKLVSNPINIYNKKSNSIVTPYSSPMSASSINSGIDYQLCSMSRSSSSNSLDIPKRYKKKKKDKNKNDNYVREDTNIYTLFNQEDISYLPNDKIDNKIIPRNEIQDKYLTALNDFTIPIIFSVGPAGTGKTLIACYYAIMNLLNNTYDKLVITRPAVSVDEEHGFLPGDIQDKMKPWLLPLYDNFSKYVSPVYIKKLIKDEVIEICPLAYMRGRTFDNAVIIADEMQNSTINQMKMLLTRIGDNSKLIINGDMSQADNPERNGLCDFIERYDKCKLGDKKNIEIIRFQNMNIQRNPIIKMVLDIYK